MILLSENVNLKNASHIYYFYCATVCASIAPSFLYYLHNADVYCEKRSNFLNIIRLISALGEGFLHVNGFEEKEGSSIKITPLLVSSSC